MALRAISPSQAFMLQRIFPVSTAIRPSAGAQCMTVRFRMGSSKIPTRQ
jgi:hypothetical protein